MSTPTGKLMPKTANMIGNAYIISFCCFANGLPTSEAGSVFFVIS